MSHGGSAALLAVALGMGNPAPAVAGTAAPGTQTPSASAASGGVAAAAPLSAALARTRAQATGRPVVADALTTETSQTTANPDGTFTLNQSPAPVRVRHHGSWVGLDATLKQNADGTLSPAATPDDVVLSGGGTGPLLALRTGGRGISLTLPLPVALPRPTVSGSTATYRNVLRGVDLTVAVQPTGAVSDVFTVHDAAAAADPALPNLLTAETAITGGLKVLGDGAGGLAVTDGSGHALFTAPTPRAWDSTATSGVAAPGAATSKNNATSKNTATDPTASSATAPAAAAHIAPLKLTVGSGKFTVAAPTGLLGASDTHYPVYLDPTFSPSYGDSGWSSPGAGYAGQNYWDSTVDPVKNITQIGNSGDVEGEALSLFDFPIDLNTLRGATIYHAAVGITETHTWYCLTGGHDQKVDLYAPSATLNSSNATWNYWVGNLGGAIGQENFALGYNATCPAGPIPAFDVTGTVAGDVAASKSVQTLAMRADDHSDNFAYKEFQQQTANLTVTYDYTPNTPSGLYTSPATNCSGSPTLGDTAVTLYAPVSTRSGAPLTTTFHLYKTSDSAKTNLLTPANGVASDTYHSGSGQSAVLALPEAFLKAQSGGAATSFTWLAQTSDGTLTSGWSRTCQLTWDPTRPGAPGIAPDPNPPAGAKTCATVGDGADPVQPVGTQCSFILSPPNGGSVSGYSYQVDELPPVTASGTGTVSVTVPVTRLVNTLTVSALSAGGNLGSSATVWFDGAAISPPAKDGDLDLDGTPDLIVPGAPGTAFPPGLWLAGGHADGTVRPGAADIGADGLAINPGTDPADWSGAQAVTGDFCGYGAQDVLAYFPAGAQAGGGAVVCDDGGDGPLHLGGPTTLGTTTPPFSIAPGALTDSSGNAATEVATAGDTSGQNNAYPDLFAVINNQLYLIYSTTPNGYRTNSGFGTCVAGCNVLSNLNSPDGSQDWNSWTLATVQLPSGTAMYLWQPSTGALDLWTGLALSADGTTLTAAGRYTLHTGTGGDTWNQGRTLLLRAADIAGKQIPDLWATDPGTGVATAYLAAGVGSAQFDTATTTVDTSDHAWLFQDIGTATAGDPLTGTTDSAGGLKLAGSTGVTWNTGDLFSPDALLNTNSDGTTPTSGGTGALTASGPAVSVSRDFSVSVRAKPNAMGGVLLSQDGAHSSGFILYPDAATRKWTFCLAKADTTAWSYDCAAGGTAQPGIWTQLTATYKAATGIMTLYVDGVDAAVATHTPVSGFTGAFNVGDYLTNNAHTAYYSGQLADIHTWSETVPPAQPETAGSTFIPVNPIRIMDTRSGAGDATGPIAVGGVVALPVAGAGGVPTTGVTAVALSVTATAPTAGGFLTAYPDGTPLPVTSNVNYATGQTITNGVIVPVGADGKVDFYAGGAGAVQIIADVTGYFTTATGVSNAGLYVPVEPSRLVDTRNGTGTPQGKLAGGGTLVLPMAGADVGTLPVSGLTAVALNLTVTDTTGSGGLNAYPDGISKPVTTAVSYNNGSTNAAMVIVPVGADGSIDIGNNSAAAGSADLVADVVGYFTTAPPYGLTGRKYHPLDATRVLDTRLSGGALSAGQTYRYTQSAVSAVNPTMVVNLTLTQETGTGLIEVYPNSIITQTGTSSANYTAGTTVANLDLADTYDNAFDVYNQGGGLQLIIDANGYFADY